jgi:hypothetical protein
VDARMQVVGINGVSDGWKVKGRVGGESGRCVCFLISSQIQSLFPLQCTGCTFPSMLPRILKAQSFHSIQRKTSSYIFGAASLGSFSVLGL